MVRYIVYDLRKETVGNLKKSLKKDLAHLRLIRKSSERRGRPTKKLAAEIKKLEKLQNDLKGVGK